MGVMDLIDPGLPRRADSFPSSGSTDMPMAIPINGKPFGSHHQGLTPYRPSSNRRSSTIVPGRAVRHHHSFKSGSGCEGHRLENRELFLDRNSIPAWTVVVTTPTPRRGEGWTSPSCRRFALRLSSDDWARAFEPCNFIGDLGSARHPTGSSTASR
jgi:hypothetical protein